MDSSDPYLIFFNDSILYYNINYKIYIKNFGNFKRKNSKSKIKKRLHKNFLKKNLKISLKNINFNF